MAEGMLRWLPLPWPRGTPRRWRRTTEPTPTRSSPSRTGRSARSAPESTRPRRGLPAGSQRRRHGAARPAPCRAAQPAGSAQPTTVPAAARREHDCDATPPHRARRARVLPGRSAPPAGHSRWYRARPPTPTARSRERERPAGRRHAPVPGAAPPASVPPTGSVSMLTRQEWICACRS